MPTYVVPHLLHNTFCALTTTLPALARANFEGDFLKRLELIPHPDQSLYDDTPGTELMPATPGTGHLDAIARWFLLGVLVDADAGALKATADKDDRRLVLTVARLYLRWLDEDYPSDNEWNDLTDETKNPPPDAPSNSYWVAWSLAMLGTDDPTLVSAALDYAAAAQGRLPLPDPCPVLALSFAGRTFDGGLNWLAARLGRGPSSGMAERSHYYWQATWLLDLVHLRWLPTDAAEESLLKKILRGNDEALPDYLKMLRRQKVEPAVLTRTEQTLRRLHEWRRRTTSKKASR